jgi:perosamine synthetase
MNEIPISAVSLGDDVEQLVIEVLRSGHLVQGPMVERLETEFAALCGVDHAVAVNSGTTALIAALDALSIGAGDEVITSAFTFVATLNAILESGATARFADIDPETFNLDPASVASLVNARTAAIMPVHLYGLPAPMHDILDLAARDGLAVIEDAAQAHGAVEGGRAVGSFGTGCFSFYATKNIASGEGGMVTTSDAALADRVRILRNQGMRARYEYEMPGHNWRMTDLHAAIALPQLERIADLTDARRANAELLTTGLAGRAGLVTPTVPHGRTHVFHQYTVRVQDGAATRAALAESLAEAGIGTGIYYPRLVHDYACYRSDPRVVTSDATPRADAATREVLSLPVHPALRAGDVERIVGCLQGA